MKKNIFYIALCGFFSLGYSFAQQPIDLAKHDQSQHIGKSLPYFEDKDRTYSIESITSLPNSAFNSYDDEILNFGYSRSVYWLKLTVNNQDSFNNWVLEIRFPILDAVSLYYKDENGFWKEKNDGLNWPFFKRDVDSRNIAFKLPPTNGGVTIYYIKIESTDVITIPVKIAKHDFFVSESLKYEVFYGICYGIMLVMFFYNLFIYSSIRDKSYMYYILHVGFAIITYGFYYGHIPQYITYYKSLFLSYLYPLLACLWLIAAIQFVKKFINLSKISLLLNRLFNVMLFLNLIVLILLFVDLRVSSQLSTILELLCAIIGLITGIVCMKKKNREARFFVLAWGFFLLCVIVTTLRGLALIPVNGFIMNILLIGSVVEITLLSFALADKINIYREEKEKAQAQTIAIQKEEATILEQKVKDRTIELEQVNKDLESFSYSVSHDLRAPLRAINGYSRILKEDYASKLEPDEMSALNAILKNSKKMEILIDDLLAFSRLGRTEIVTSEINMVMLVQSIIEEEKDGNSNEIEFKINELIPSNGAQTLIKQVWVNFISNAIKYSKNNPKPHIEIGSYHKDNFIVYYVKDNGAGFDMQYYGKLFGVFQRLHSQEEFEGTGIGLAIVQKIIQRHQGTVWAESKLNEGSCFYFSLPIINT